MGCRDDRKHGLGTCTSQAWMQGWQSDEVSAGE